MYIGIRVSVYVCVYNAHTIHLYTCTVEIRDNYVIISSAYIILYAGSRSSIISYKMSVNVRKFSTRIERNYSICRTREKKPKTNFEEIEYPWTHHHKILHVT